MSRTSFTAAILAALFSLPAFALDLIYTAPPLTEVQRERLVKNLDRRWENLQKKSPNMGVREMFGFSLDSAEADYRLDRIDGALALAEQMQDLDPTSRTYGNFRWYWGAERPEDLNAVQFSMQDAALLWMRHRDRLPADARQRLERLIKFSVEGIRRHNVRESYTNIFLMKTWNCVALGESTGRPDLAREGYAMMDAWLLYTWENGIHEYISPTYYGTDVDSLVLIAKFSQNERPRKQAEAALKLFWTDIAANWFEPCLRLGGAHSRDYDYLTGHGYLDTHLQFAGWLETKPEWTPQHFAALTGWKPSAEFRTLALERLPRMVRQRWGGLPGERSAHYVGRAISLGTAGSSYADPMDKTLTVNFAGGPKMPVVNFMMDARNDPFGKSKEPTGGGHKKAFHLTPFLMSVQREREALLLAAISPQDRGFQRPAPNPTCLLSQLVLPRDGVTVWTGDEPCNMAFGAASTEPVPTMDVREILQGMTLSAADQQRLGAAGKIEVATPNRAFEVERALLVEPPFEVGEDAKASGGRFVWKPGTPGEAGPGGGRAVIPVLVPTAGSYNLYGRVLAPTPSDDSFSLRIRKGRSASEDAPAAGNQELLPLSDWHIGTHEDWTWAPVRFSSDEASSVELPAGLVLLEIVCREDGTKIDQILVADRRGVSKPVPLSQPVFVRHKDAAAGFRILHAVNLQGGPAPAELRTDGSALNAMTLTVTHSATKPESGRASVALWTRVAEGLDDAGFARFRKDFAQAAATATFDGTTLEVTAQGLHAPLRLKANLEKGERQVCEGDEPGAADALLSIDGKDVGREILQDVDPIARYRRMAESADGSDALTPDRPFEVERAALIVPPFEVGEDKAASGGKFVWKPGEPGGKGPAGGRALIPVRVPTAGTYYLWARVQAPTPDDDSFFIRIRQGATELLPVSDWPTGIHKTWEWVAVELGPNKQRAIALPAGVVLLEVLCREDGAKMDQIWLTADGARKP